MKKVFLLEKKYLNQCEILINEYNKALVNLYLGGKSSVSTEETIKRKNEEILQFLKAHLDVYYDMDVMEIKKIYGDESRVGQLMNSNILNDEEANELVEILDKSIIPMVLELSKKLKYAIKNNMFIVFYFE